MRSRLHSLQNSPALDAVVAVGLFVAAEIETATAHELSTFGLAVPFLTLTLALRRRAPLAVALGAAVALALLSLGPEIDFPSSAALIGTFGVAYSAAAHLARREAILGLAAIMSAFEIEAIVQRGEPLNSDLIFAAIVTVVPWAIGRTARGLREREEAIAAAVAELARRRGRTSELAAEAERLTVARELHDTVGGLLNLVIVHAALAERDVVAAPDRARGALDIVLESGRRAMLDLQRMLAILRPGGNSLAPAPGLDRVAELVELTRMTGVDVELRVRGRRPGLSPALDLSAYRIVQEALSNVARHAAGARAVVEIVYADDAVRVSVTDDGGRPAAADAGGHGLAGMRERAALFGGELDAAPREGGGFAVRASLPLMEAPA